MAVSHQVCAGNRDPCLPQELPVPLPAEPTPYPEILSFYFTNSIINYFYSCSEWFYHRDTIVNNLLFNYFQYNEETYPEIHAFSFPIYVFFFPWVYLHTIEKLSGILKEFQFNSQAYLKKAERSPVLPTQVFITYLTIFMVEFFSGIISLLSKEIFQQGVQVKMCFSHILYVVFLSGIMVPFRF